MTPILGLIQSMGTLKLVLTPSMKNKCRPVVRKTTRRSSRKGTKDRSQKRRSQEN